MRTVLVVAALGHAAIASPLPPLAPSVSLGHFWFTDARCRAEFPNAGEVSGAKLDRLDACLATLELKRSDRSAPLDDIAVYSYEPGLELLGKLVDGKLVAISTPGGELIIDSASFVRTSGDKYIEPDDVDKVTMMRAGWSRIEPVLELCIDADGAPTRVDVVHPSGLVNYDNKLRYSIESWRYKPYRDGGHAIEACTVIHFVYDQN